LNLFKKHQFQQWGYLPEVAQLDDQKRDLVILGRKV
jgi:L-amino acid N-acyltransferase YncA